MSVLVCENISKVVKRKEVIKNFSYNFLENQVYAILGKSDSGHSELLHMISGKSKPANGTIFLDGYDLLKNNNISDRICFISHSTSFPNNITILDIFRIMARSFPNWDTYYAYEILNHFEINYKTRFGKLTKQEKTILIGILNLASRANITIMDNPMDDVDIKVRYDFFNYLYDHQVKYPRTFIITTSFIDEIDYLVDKLLLFDKGKLIASFTTQEAKENFRYLTGKTEVLKSLISGVKVIGVEERGKTLTICVRQNLKKDEIRKYHKYLIEISKVPIQKIFIYLINLREIKGISNE